MAKAIEKADPRTNTYMPLSAGIESTAALVYAAKDPNLHAFCVHWYEQRYGLFADAMAFYTQKQAEYFDLPYGNALDSTFGDGIDVPYANAADSGSALASGNST